MSEQDMRQNVHKALKPWHALAVENRCGAGTPDTNYGGMADLHKPCPRLASQNHDNYECCFCHGQLVIQRFVQAEGWIELKWLRAWPKRESTRLEIRHYTKQQRLWHKKRWHVGGTVWLLLQVGKDWLLFDGDTAATVVGRATRDELFKAARHTFHGYEENKERLKSCLIR